MSLVTLGSKLPRLVHYAACWAIRSVLGDAVFAGTLGESEPFEVKHNLMQAVSKPKSVNDFWYWIDRRDKYTSELNQLVSSSIRRCARAYAEMWNTNKFDAVICPVQAVPALEHDRTADLSPLA